MRCPVQKPVRTSINLPDKHEVADNYRHNGVTHGTTDAVVRYHEFKTMRRPFETK